MARRWSAVVVLSAAALAAAACGSGSSGTARTAGADTLIAHAAEKLSALHSFRFDADVVYSRSQPPVAETGVVDLAAEAADLRFPRRTGDQGARRVIAVNGKQYVSPPLIPAAGKTWTVMSGSPRLGTEEFAGVVSPAWWLSTFHLLEHQKIIGTEKVRRIEVTHLSGVLKNDSRYPGPAAYSVDVWFDQQNVLRKLRIAGDSNDGFEGTYWFYDFGVSVRVTPPPATEVAVMPTASGILPTSPSTTG